MMKEAEQIVSQLNWLIDELHSYEESELAEKKARVKAVSKSIETLQRGNLPVPEDLIRMRDALWTELKELDHPENVLSYLRDELHVVLKRISKPGRSGGTEQQRMYSGRISNETPRFTQSDLEPILIYVLRDFGGSASKKAVEDEIERRLQNEFSPADLDTVSEGIPRWKKNVEWVRFHLVERGVMQKDSRRGVWALEE
jgi:hypothetical protein